MRKWIVETKDGDWKITTGDTFRAQLFRVPKVQNGIITLGGVAYSVEPRKFRRMPYRKLTEFFLITHYAQIQLWREGDPEPIDLLTSGEGTPEGGDGWGRKFAMAMEDRDLNDMLFPRYNLMLLLLLLSIIGNIGLAAAVAFVKVK